MVINELNFYIGILVHVEGLARFEALIFYCMDFNKLKPHLIVVVAFLAITFSYFSPVFQGKQLAQHDVVQSVAMAKEVLDYHEQTGDYALWTGRMFGGMPVYQIWLGTKTNIFKKTWLGFRGLFKEPMDVVLVYLFVFYFFLSTLGFKPVYSALGAIGFAFSSYNFIIIEAGHLAKVMALGFSPGILAGIYLILREKYLKGTLVTAIFVGMQIHSNHVQITYYLFFVIVIWMVYEFYQAIKSKEVPQFVKSAGIMALAAILGVLPNITPLLTTKNYVEETIRGAQELSVKKIDGNGLDTDYATAWSYGKLETLTLLFPNIMGGASGGSLDKDSETYEVLVSKGISKKQAEGFIKGLPLYWGPQQFISGPIYFGAIVVLLALLGVFLSKNKYKWWLLIATIFCMFISWGKNMMWFYSIFFDYFPMFNKFRSPSMILAVGNITTIWLALLGLEVIYTEGKENLKKVLRIGGSLAGFCLIMALVGSSFLDFSSQYNSGGVSSDDRFEQQMTQMAKNKQFGQDLVTAIQVDRATMLQTDAFRSFFLVAITLLLIYLFVKGKIKEEYMAIALVVAVLGDLWQVDKRYLNGDDFKKLKNITKEFKLSAAESRIMQDTDPNFRVLNTTINMFNDASPNYFYNTIGGYHAAKLKRYQDLIEYRITPELSKLNQGFDKAPILNMLNMKYVIFGREENAVALNQNRLGNAWAVNKIVEVNTADDEMEAIGNFNPSQEAVVDVRFKEYYQNFVPNTGTNASIKLTKYEPMKLIYDFNSSKDELVVFSEVYYHGNEDWIAYIDGKEAPHFRANYVLRAMVVPAGEHTIEFKFHPSSYYLGENISLGGSAIIILLLGAYLFKAFKSTKTEEKI